MRVVVPMPQVREYVFHNELTREQSRVNVMCEFSGIKMNTVF